MNDERRRIDVEPLDPDSPKGREVAARLSVTFAEVREAIAMRQAREAAEQAIAKPTGDPEPEKTDS